MFDRFKIHMVNTFSFLFESKLLIALSGGIDSVVLAHLCKELNLNFALAHCNFNLRDKESDDDEDFVMELAENMEVEVFIESFDTENYAKQNKLSVQMAARELRYNWFKELANQLQFEYILTAHHADDNLETFLINLSRGTGLDGLIGIPEINENIIRPLLPFSRLDLKNYAEAKHIKWREDSSNASDKYLRNKLRLDIIPRLKGLNPQFLENFIKTQGFLMDSRSIIEDSIDSVLEEVISKISENEIHFNIDKINELSNPGAYLYEIFKDYGFTEWNDVLDLLDAQSGKQIFSKTHRLLKDRDELILTGLSSNTSSSTVERLTIKKEDKQIQTPLGLLFFDEADAIFGKRTNVIYVDKDLLKFPLKFRKWEEGDYFYPFGMKGKKKLSKFFKDEKLSLVAKEKTWLLCSNNDVIWVVNHRLDDRFKVTENTKNILKISVE